MFYISIILLLVKHVYGQTILNNLIQEQSIYKILNEDHDFHIWIRFQTQFIQLLNIKETTPFMLIKDHKSKIQITFSFQVYKNKVDVFLIEQNITNSFTITNNYSQWYYIYLNKQEQFEFSTLDQQKIIFSKSQNYIKQSHYGVVCTWQNVTFSLKAFKQELGSLSDHIIIKNDDMVLLSKVLIMNYRDLIKLQFYFRQTQLNQTGVFFKMEDEIQLIKLLMIRNSILLMDEANMKKYSIFGIGLEWNFISISFSNYKTIFTLFTKDEHKIFTHIIEKDLSVNFIIGIEMQFFDSEIQFGNFAIISNQNIFPSLCYPNCQECNHNICLKCFDNLSLDNYCTCIDGQYYDQDLQLCQDIIKHQLLQKEIQVQNEYDCEFGSYYNIITKKCQNCPRLDQFQCLDCFYNTELWYENKSCKFQEIQTIHFMQLYFTNQLAFPHKTRVIKFNQNISEINDDETFAYDQDNGFIFQPFKDPHNILDFICQSDYQFNKNFKKCAKLPRGILSQSQFILQCKLGYANISNQCRRCPQLCLFCEYQQQKLVCLIPQKGFYLSGQQIKRCNQECPYCLNISQCNQDITINELISTENCILQQDKLCMFCQEDYFLDHFNNCVEKQKIFNFYQFYFVIRQFPKELNLYQINNFMHNCNKSFGLAKQTKSFRAQFGSLSYFIQDGQINNSDTNYFKKENYKFLSYQNKTFYCPDNQCYYSLNLNVTIYFSNRQLIIYQNMTFYNFQDLFNYIKQQQIYLSKIKVIADVYVFETVDQECQDFQVFFVNFPKVQDYLQYTNFEIILNFQQYSIFPDCIQYILITFDHVEINYLVTSSQIDFKIQSNYLKFFKCNFQKQEQKFSIISKEILFLNTTFMNKALVEPLITFEKFTKINYLHFINCNFVDMISNNTNFIRINTDINDLMFQNTEIYNVHVGQSYFIELDYVFKSILIDDMHIKQLEVKNGFFFSNTATNNADISFQSINMEASNFENSTFILSKSKTKIQEIEIDEVDIKNSLFINIKQDCIMTNIQFINTFSSESLLIIISGNKFAQLTQILFINSIFDESSSLISVTTSRVYVNNVQLYHSSYRPNFKFMQILSRQLNLDNVQILDLKVFSQQLVLSSLYIILIQGHTIQIQNFTLNQIEVSQIKILNIIYQTLTFQNFELSNTTWYQQLQGDVISINQMTRQSICQLKFFTIKDLLFKQQSLLFLFLFQGQYGQSFCSQFNFQNIRSFNSFHLFRVQRQFIQFTQIQLIDLDQIGLIYQNGSITHMKYFYYQAIVQKNNDYDCPIFQNLASYNELCVLQLSNSILKNLVQPLIQSKNSGQLKVILKNITLVDCQFYQDIIQILQLISSEFYTSLLKLENIQVKNVTGYHFLISTYNVQSTIIHYVFFFNTQIKLIESINQQQMIISDFKVVNSSHQTLSFIELKNLKNYQILNNIFMINMTLNVFNRVSSDVKTKARTIMSELYFQQLHSSTIFILNFTTQNYLILRNLKIYTSQVDIIKFIQDILQSNKIENIYIQDSKMYQIFDTTQKSTNIKIDQLYLFNNEFLSNQTNNMISFENSFAFNCSFQDYSVQIFNKRLEFWNNMIDQNSPLFLSFHQKRRFLQVQINQNVQQVQFNNNSMIYLPTGIPIDQYTKIDFITQQQERIYDYFAIVSNYPEDLQCTLQSSIDNQIGNYTNLNQFTILNQVNVIDNFTFYYNPYQNYSYIQNDIACDKLEFILRFNVRILPCQLGEYFNQNQCKVCDVDRLQYSVNRIAYFCNIIDINKIEKAKRGQIKLRQGYWRPQIDNNFIEYCNSELCLGGWQVGDHSCTQGQLGALCKECDIYNTRGQGQYAQNESGCLLCDYSFQLLFKGFLIISWLMFLVYLSYDTNKQVILQYLQFKISQRKLADILMRQSLNQISVIIKICTNYSFYLYLIKNNLDYLYSNVNLSLNLLSNPTQLISPQLDCLLVQNNQLKLPYANLIFTLLNPFYVLSLFYLIYLLALYLKLAKFQFNVILITIYSVYLFNQQLILQRQLYILISQIKLLSFVNISNIDWIYQNQSYQYNTKQHYNMIFYLILPTTILFALIPIIIYLLIRNKDRRSISIIKYYGMLYREYKQSTYYWEIVRIYQKFLTIIQLYVYNQQNESYYIFLIQIYLIVLIYFSPYPLKNLNQLEQRSLVNLNWCLIITFFMKDSSIYIRAILFAIININLILDVISNLIKKIRIQYKDTLFELNKIIVSKIPQSQKFINLKKSITAQQNIEKVRTSVIKMKSRTISTRSIYIKNDILLSTNLSEQLFNKDNNQAEHVKSEIEMIAIKQKEQ